MNKNSAILTEQDFRAAVAKQCGFPVVEELTDDCLPPKDVLASLGFEALPLQLKDREPTDAEVLSALQFALNDDQLSVMEQSYDQFQIEGGDE